MANSLPSLIPKISYNERTVGPSIGMATAQFPATQPPVIAGVMEQLDVFLINLLKEKQAYNEEANLSLLSGWLGVAVPAVGSSGQQPTGGTLTSELMARSRPSSPAVRNNATASTLHGAGGFMAGVIESSRARWGVSEGGLDNTGWVRSLVRMSGSSVEGIATGPCSPSSNAAAAGGSPLTDAEVAPSTVTTLNRPVTTAALKPTSRREDVSVLYSWLEDVLSQVSKGTFMTRPGASSSAASASQVLNQLQSGPQTNNLTSKLRPSSALQVSESGTTNRPLTGSNPTSAVAADYNSSSSSLAVPSSMDLADGMLHVYKVAFQEIQKQVMTECRERGELLGLIWDHVWIVCELRGGLVAEDRLSELQCKFEQVLRSKENLEQNVKILEENVVEAGKEQAALSNAAATQSRSLALKLAAAQRAAVEIEEQRRVANKALEGEVLRRFEATGELESVKELMKRTELEWLKYRAENKKLIEELEYVASKEEDRQKELRAVRAEAEAARSELRVHLDVQASREVELAKVRHEHETDEILVMSLQQLVKELEGQLQQLKGYTRDQALKMAEYQQDIEGLQANLEQLNQELGRTTVKRDQLHHDLTSTSVQLHDVTGALETKDQELQRTTQIMKAQISANQEEISGLDQEVRQLTLRLEDTQYKLSVKEGEYRVVFSELEAAREAVGSIAITLKKQGVAGIPPAVDKSWETVGPLGALQKCLVLSNRQLETLFEHRATLKSEATSLTERLKNELDAQRVLQKELYSSRSAETETLRQREMITMKLDVTEHQRHHFERESLGLQDQVKTLTHRLKLLEDEKRRLQSKTIHMAPFEGKYNDAEAERLSLVHKCNMLQEVCQEGKEGMKQMTEAQDYLKKEIDTLIKANQGLSENIRQLNLLKYDIDDLAASKSDAVDETKALEARLELVLQSHALTNQKLQMATLLLQGLDPGDGSRSALNMIGSIQPSSAMISAGQQMASTTATGSLYAASAAGGGSPGGVGLSNRGNMPTSLGAMSPDDVALGHVPNEVAALMHERGIGQKMTKSKDRWLLFKMKFLSYFSNMLREKLRIETERRTALEVEKLEMESYFLEEARAREEFVAKELVGGLRGLVSRVRHDCLHDLHDLREFIPDIQRLTSHLAATSATMGMALKAVTEKLQAKTAVSTQTDVELESNWASYIRQLPRKPPSQPLSLAVLSEAIVRVYVRQVNSVELLPVSGAQRKDTIYDDIMVHYQAQIAPGTFKSSYLQDDESPVARLVRSCPKYEHCTKVAMFCFFLGTSSQAVHWNTAAWHFFLHCLHCLKVLLAGTWRSTVRQWATEEGTCIPIQAAFDVVGNLLNVQNPNDLDGAMTKRLAALIFPGSGEAGSMVDLDALLMLLVNEFNEGNCPRNSLLFPRRLTDGQLFNIFNSSGHSPYLDGITSTRNIQTYISTAKPAPGSPAAAFAALKSKQQAVGATAATIAARNNKASHSYPAGGTNRPATAAPTSYAAGSLNKSPQATNTERSSANAAAMRLMPSRPGSSDSRLPGGTTTPLLTSLPPFESWQASG
ncbi:hypothetical protein CEUSTIGMA_g6082.t1 [Chlamydomonas eustigma]|uniref:Uncharacterized protein n=1 Tax=Chlamydomonas eustigma TaxID=1157962 RepID=A0A250X6D2_9CHLO|nr:hypothetical protein CEUSTIGMA_g6082.t1 [Chlamydomonas eustigma]|eukprot:GAX78644.1 hypothetical protein CEUSTIGMA_g6082.t1 [Chlamydomonas eustigma]